MSKIRVARIITRLNVGGPAYQATMLNHRLSKLDYECLLIHGQISPGESSFDQLLQDYPSRNEYCQNLQRRPSPIADFKALNQITKILKQFKPDIVHTHTAKAGLIGRIAARRANAKAIIHTYHGHVLDGYFGGLTSKLILTAEQYLARRSDKLITVSNRLTNELSERFKIAPKEKFQTIELGLPLKRFLNLPPKGQLRSQLNIPDDAILIGTLGRLVSVKNHDKMLKVFAALTQKFANKNLHLIIGGSGQLLSNLKATANDLNITKKVHFAGVISDLPSFYADIDIALLTSDNEGTPVTLLEAQSAGKWVVAPDVGGIADVIHPDVSKLVSPNEIEAYIHELSPIIENWPTQQPTDQYRKLTVERFSPDRLLAEIDDLYKKLLNQQKLSS